MGLATSTTSDQVLTVILSPAELAALTTSLVDDLDASFDGEAVEPGTAVAAYLTVLRAIADTGHHAAIVAVEDFDRMLADDEDDDA